MKTILILISAITLNCFSQGTISPTVDRRGFVGGTFSGTGGNIGNLNLTNITFYKADGDPCGQIDDNGTFIFYDSGFTPRVSFDPVANSYNITDSVGNTRVDVTATTLTLLTPTITGIATVEKSLGATNGLASYSTVTAASIATTGWTNIWSTNNATVYIERGASVAVTVKDRSNTTLHTTGAHTSPLTINLQPGWGFSASGNLSGKAVPF